MSADLSLENLRKQVKLAVQKDSNKEPPEPKR
jgi:hypothetical protein